MLGDLDAMPINHKPSTKAWRKAIRIRTMLGSRPRWSRPMNQAAWRERRDRRAGVLRRTADGRLAAPGSVADDDAPAALREHRQCGLKREI
jgi:hypothetical protein